MIRQLEAGCRTKFLACSLVRCVAKNRRADSSSPYYNIVVSIFPSYQYNPNVTLILAAGTKPCSASRNSELAELVSHHRSRIGYVNKD